ncbi:M15 family metallopeptidase [Synechococcus sp. CS-197]|uniref:M15 family metallopeptidase n=1 Tax=Synechococcus sp. CS-197 TaxID=2847985 RepID=UPI00015255D4|nr:M15 family metallopeptidase [Synechococcus sp. CS-197]MCT0252170.1 M15 family metallopeptidase [Synechococcus sp. CS-197]PTU04433.1 D-alanyl-D-alanine dipeptidase [Pseudomonas sp. HMWF031]CAK23746.1 D-ala-D-ala dipeptidase [Synechococcus sp. WH 7803]
MRRPWSDVAIKECGEPLQSLRGTFLCLEPHPYAKLGAPYGDQGDPFRLRASVIARLVRAQNQLIQHPDPEVGPLQLLVLDAWRPVSVQAFMIEHAIEEECGRRGLNPSKPQWQTALDEVKREVSRFWAPPSEDRSMPPPHSTGAAIDLTLADQRGAALNMGGAFDAIGSESLPDHHASAAKANPNSPEALWHQRRCSLHAAMKQAGFVRHPNEWWHFSHGDQLWAWTVAESIAVYGRVDGDACAAASSSATRSSPSRFT